MDLEKLKQEAEALQNIDATQFSPEQLAELVNKLSSILEQSEESLINTTLIELNKPTDENK
jgi:acyl-CoA reductase-like NAD-dependent aldehyde dehydrogenase